MPANDPYCGPAPVPSELWTSWNLDPWLIGGFLLAAVLYAFAAWRSPDVHRRETACFASGWIILAILFNSPFCALTSALFSARVAHHVIMIAVAAPLIVLGCPFLARSQVKANGLGVLFMIQMITIWFWHAPAPYAAALNSHGIFWLMQVTLLGTALLFWGTLALRPPSLSALLPLLGNVVQMGLLGALITFAPSALYEPHFGTTAPWGITPLEDQQIAGLIMWIPAAIPYVVAALLVVGAGIGRASSLTRGSESRA